MEGTSQRGTVVGYPRAEGEGLSHLLARTPPSRPRVWPLVVALVLGLFPLLVPFAVWATVDYWRRPLSQPRWRAVAVVMLALGLVNFVAFLVYGYGRHWTIG